MNIPTVTEDDLRRFGSKHFPAASLPVKLFWAAEDHGYEHFEEDDGLGYYPDGAKRTLTDDNIAYLRYKEIRAILEARRVRATRNATISNSTTKPTEELPASTVEDQSTSLSNDAAANEQKKQRKAKKYTPKRQEYRAKQNRERRKRRRKEFKLLKKKFENAGKPADEADQASSDESDSNSEMSESEGSDEWTPQRQAKGPDNIHNIAVDLDY